MLPKENQSEILKAFFGFSGSNLDQLTKLIEEMSKPFFQLKQVGITSKILSDWEELGIIDRSIQEAHSDVQEIDEKRKWRRFNFFEFIWISFVSELKKYGVDNDSILDYRKELFPIGIEAHLEFYKRQLFENDLPEKKRIQIEEAVRKLESGNKTISEDFKEPPLSLFSIIVVSICLNNANVVFFYNDEDSNFFTLQNQPTEKLTEQLNEIMQMIATKSCAMINLRSLIRKVYDNERVDINSDYFFNLMNDQEKQVIAKIRSGLYKEVIVKMDNGVITNMRLSKKNNEDLIRSMTRQMKKGEYKQVELVVRDGKIVKAEETEVIKLK